MLQQIICLRKPIILEHMTLKVRTPAEMFIRKVKTYVFWIIIDILTY